MRRFLLNPFTPDYADIDVAMVSFGKAEAVEWLAVKVAFDDARRALGDKLLYFTIDRSIARFFQGWPTDLSDLIDTLSDEGHVSIPPDLEADFSIPPEVEPDGSSMMISENGVAWRAFFDNGLMIETAMLLWETIREVADEAEPANNSGRQQCWWCGARTRQTPMFTGVVDECPLCRR